jgi:nitrogenase molybdenum-iron protein alpha/beta subunit
MNPITLGSKTPPPITIQRSMYEVLEKQPLDPKALNFIGNFVPISKECELHQVLKSIGIEETHFIGEKNTFEEFQQMAKSNYNLVLRPEGLTAAKDMMKKHGNEYLFLPVIYDLDEIKTQYQTISEKIGKISLDLIACRKNAETEIKKTKKLLKNKPILIDASSVCKPYSLAVALLKYGFHVKAIFADVIPEHEKESVKWLKQNAPHINIHQAEHHNMIQRAVENGEDQIAIGYNAGYMTKARYVVDLVFDETMFGYYGVVQLMKKMQTAFETPKPLKELIDAYGLVV